MSWIKENSLNWFQLLALKIMKTGHVPKHIAFIMDGNRRYASKNHVTKLEGHSEGFNKLSHTLKWCIDLGVVEVTVYAFSIENFKRTKEEVDALMYLTKEKFKCLIDDKDRLMQLGVRIRVIGNLSLLPEDIRKLIAEIMIITKNNKKTFLNVAFAYTSRDEITCAIKDIIKGIKHNELLPEDIDEDVISECLYTYNSSNPDLLIRTSGEVRLSDFLMWQASETCIYFTSVLWPEFTIWDFLSAIFYYQKSYPDLQRITRMHSSRQIMHNNRVATYINKLHHNRQVMIENFCLPTVQS